MGCPPTLLRAVPLQPGTHLEGAFALTTTPGFPSEGTPQDPMQGLQLESGAPKEVCAVPNAQTAA